MLLGVGGDAEGNSVALFGREDGVLTANGYDAAPPRIASLSVPSDGIAGDPLDFAATGLDVWSGPVTDVTWDFGDGERASGAALRHAYADAGARVIEATLRDAVGNESSGFAVTTIDAPIAVPTIIPTPAGSPPSPPPPPPPPPVRDTRAPSVTLRHGAHATLASPPTSPAASPSRSARTGAPHRHEDLPPDPPPHAARRHAGR